jgi:hypothetical protein
MFSPISWERNDIFSKFKKASWVLALGIILDTNKQ